MATPKFSYPDYTADDYSADEFYLPFRLSGGVYGAGRDVNRQHEDVAGFDLNRDIGKTLGGLTMIDDLGGSKRRWQFSTHVWNYSAPAPDGAPHYYSPHEIDLNDVLIFVRDFALDSFDWTDIDGVVRRVRLVSNSFDFRPFGLDETWVSFQLEEA
jgi:hypothetical protein